MKIVRNGPGVKLSRVVLVLSLLYDGGIVSAQVGASCPPCIQELQDYGDAASALRFAEADVVTAQNGILTAEEILLGATVAVDTAAISAARACRFPTVGCGIALIVLELAITFK